MCVLCVILVFLVQPILPIFIWAYIIGLPDFA